MTTCAPARKTADFSKKTARLWKARRAQIGNYARTEALENAFGAQAFPENIKILRRGNILGSAFFRKTLNAF